MIIKLDKKSVNQVRIEFLKEFT